VPTATATLVPHDDLRTVHRDVHARDTKLLQLVHLDDLLVQVSIHVALAEIVRFPPKVELLALALKII